MNQPDLDLFAMLTLSLIGTIVFAFRAYTAWFLPEEHEEFLIAQKGLFRQESPPSRFTVWFTRISYSTGFVLTSGVLIWTIISLILG